jgi:hypothetical protein
MERRLFAALLFGLTTAAGWPVAAQTYPAHPVRLVIPVPPGGSADVVGRLLANAVSAELGQPVIVDNRAGAAGSVGTASALKAPADGYTLVQCQHWQLRHQSKPVQERRLRPFQGHGAGDPAGLFDQCARRQQRCGHPQREGPGRPGQAPAHGLRIFGRGRVQPPRRRVAQEDGGHRDDTRAIQGIGARHH